MNIKSSLWMAAALFLGACGEADKSGQELTVIDGFAQGGTYHIVVKSDRPREIKHEIDSLFQVVDNSMSLYNPNSLLSRINRNETDVLDPFIIDCINTAQQVSVLSDGLYDITIKPLTSAYGFAGDSVVQHPNVDSLLPLIGYQKISIQEGRLVKADPRMQLDLNSIAQGATSDFIASYLEKQGIHDYIIEIGGEIFCRGTNALGEPWRVGIDRPTEGNITPGADLQVVIGLSGQGLATSGNYRKFYTDDQGRKIVHTINPKTGQPVISNLLSVTIVASTAAWADAYGTMCMVMGLEASKTFLATHPQIQAYMIYSDEAGNYQTYVTPSLQQMIANQASQKQSTHE